MAVLRCLVHSRKCEVICTVDVPKGPLTRFINHSGYSAFGEIYPEPVIKGRRNSCKHIGTNHFHSSMTEAPEQSKTKCDKYLPFRKRLFNKYRKEKNSSDEDATANKDPQRSTSSGRLSDVPHTSHSTKEWKDTNVKEDTPLQLNLDEEHCAETNFQKEFENLHLLAEITSDIRIEDPGEGSSSSIPLTVESLPSTSTSNTKKHPLTCKYCRKKFHHKGDMNKHLRSHTKEQPYKCTYCSLKFSHTSNLQRHLRIHTGSKPHSCDCCKKRFSRIDKLHLHQKNGICRENK